MRKNEIDKRKRKEKGRLKGEKKTKFERELNERANYETWNEQVEGREKRRKRSAKEIEKVEEERKNGEVGKERGRDDEKKIGE